MPGLAEIALGAAPIAGGALLGAVAGNLKGPDVRAVIKTDLDLLDRIPEDQVQRRAAMSQMIAGRIDDLIGADQNARQLRQAAANYQGDWRDVVVFICTGAVHYRVVARQPSPHQLAAHVRRAHRHVGDRRRLRRPRRPAGRETPGTPRTRHHDGTPWRTMTIQSRTHTAARPHSVDE